MRERALKVVLNLVDLLVTGIGAMAGIIACWFCGTRLFDSFAAWVGTVERDSNMIDRFVAIAGLSALVGCGHIDSGTIRTDSATSAGGGYRTTRFGALTDTIVHLSGGDSVELQSAGVARVPKQTDGLMVTYHPYFDLADTERVKQTALAVFDALRPKFLGDPPWVVLRAASRPAVERNRGGGPQDHFYGVVLERLADGHWYPLGEHTPVR